MKSRSRKLYLVSGAFGVLLTFLCVGIMYLGRSPAPWTSCEQFLPLHTSILKGDVLAQRLSGKGFLPNSQNMPQIDEDILYALAELPPHEIGTFGCSFGPLLIDGVIEDLSPKSKSAFVMSYVGHYQLHAPAGDYEDNNWTRIFIGPLPEGSPEAAKLSLNKRPCSDKACRGGWPDDPDFSPYPWITRAPTVGTANIREGT